MGEKVRYCGNENEKEKQTKAVRWGRCTVGKR